MSVLPVGMGSSAVDVGDIGHSLRLRASASAYLSRTFGTPTNNQKFVYSDWIKRGSLGSAQFVLQAGDATNQEAQWYFQADDTLRFYQYTGSHQYDYDTVAKFRDPTASLHLFVLYDSTQATAANRFRVWINGVEQTLTRTVEVSLNATNSKVNSAVSHDIGGSNIENRWFDGYRARTCLVDGVAAVTDFGYENTDINEWVSKTQSQVLAVVEAGGTNSFMLDFDDATSLTTLGYDKSTKNNDWTLNNISLTAGITYDHMLDVPGNSYATLNPIAPNATYAIGTLQAGNLEKVAGASNNEVQGTLGVTSGKWYFEFSFATNATRVGIATGGPGKSAIGTKGVLYENSTGNKLIDGGSAAYGATFTQVNVIGVALDADTNSVTFYKDNASQGAISFTPTDVISPSIFTPNATTITAYFNAGQRPFTYTPPTGFLALCQANLPTPAILNPELHFDAKTRTGTDGVVSVTGIGFQPDLFWTKARSTASYGHRLVDSVRGVTKALLSHSTSAEVTDATGLTAFNADGYTLGAALDYNDSPETYIDWLWKAGGAAVANNDGSIASQVSANVLAGFSIATYTGTGANATVGHGLGVAPKMVIVQKRDGSGAWVVYHQNANASPASGNLYLCYTNAFTTEPTLWNNTAPSSTVFSLGTYGAGNTSTSTYVAYCFAEISGYSKIGSYVGNGAADGPYVECGFKPKFVLIKRTDTAGNNWVIGDASRNTYNVGGTYLYPNLANAEDSTHLIDSTATGFKPRDTGGNHNASGGTYIFYAIADVAGKYSNAR